MLRGLGGGGQSLAAAGVHMFSTGVVWRRTGHNPSWHCSHVGSTPELYRLVAAQEVAAVGLNAVVCLGCGSCGARLL